MLFYILDEYILNIFPDQYLHQFSMATEYFGLQVFNIGNLDHYQFLTIINLTLYNLFIHIYTRFSKDKFCGLVGSKGIQTFKRHLVFSAILPLKCTLISFQSPVMQY